MTTETPTPTAVFVYGTLRPGFGNHDWTVGHLPHRAVPAFVSGFRLVGQGRPFPYAVPDPAAVTIGEVLAFEEPEWPEALSAMDRLEGYPVHYDRVLVEATTRDRPQRTLAAWLYTPVGDRYAALPPVPGGDWRNNRRDRDWSLA